MIWLRAALFFLAVPGTVLGLVPAALVSYGPRTRVDAWPLRFLGLAAAAAGVGVILWCSVEFVRRGRGTAAPYDPPRELVAAGLYRWVRNPMYVAAVLAVVGEALWTGAPVLLAYAAALAIAYDLFVRLYEEPRLRKAFGPAYERYCAAVPRWLPRRPGPARPPESAVP